MKISIHIPKTAGTLFAEVLKANHANRLAFFYGPEDPRTHPALRQEPPFDDGVVRRLEDGGIEWVHGHFAAAHWKGALPNPADYVVWLRDPIERIVSNYYFHKRELDEGNPIARSIFEGEMSLVEFARLPLIEHIFRRMIHPFSVEGFGFVGISELFEPCLAVLGLEPVKGKRYANVNPDKPSVDLETRKRIADHNIYDVAAYSAALAQTTKLIEETANASAQRGGLLSRLIR